MKEKKKGSRQIAKSKLPKKERGNEYTPHYRIVSQPRDEKDTSFRDWVLFLSVVMVLCLLAEMFSEVFV